MKSSATSGEVNERRALEITAALKGNGRAGEDDKHGAGFHAHVPLLGAESPKTGMNSGGRLAGNKGPAGRAGVQIHELGVAVEKPGGWVEKVNQGRLAGPKAQGQDAQGNLLIAVGEIGL